MHIPCSIQIVRTYKVALQQNSLNLKALDERKNRDSIKKEGGPGPWLLRSIEKSSPWWIFFRFSSNALIFEPTTGHWNRYVGGYISSLLYLYQNYKESNKYFTFKPPTPTKIAKIHLIFTDSDILERNLAVLWERPKVARSLKESFGDTTSSSLNCSWRVLWAFVRKFALRKAWPTFFL